MTRYVIHIAYAILYLPDHFKVIYLEKPLKQHANIMHLYSYGIINTNPIMPLVSIMAPVCNSSLSLPVERLFQLTDLFACIARYLGLLYFISQGTNIEIGTLL